MNTRNTYQTSSANQKKLFATTSGRSGTVCGLSPAVRRDRTVGDVSKQIHVQNIAHLSIELSERSMQDKKRQTMNWNLFSKEIQTSVSTYSGLGVVTPDCSGGNSVSLVFFSPAIHGVNVNSEMKYQKQ